MRFDFKIVPLLGREGRHLRPRERVVGAQLFRRGQGVAILAGATVLAGQPLAGRVKLGVLAHPADQDGVFRQAAQQGAVGEASVAHPVDRPFGHGAQMLHAPGGDFVDVGLFAGLHVGRLGGFVRVARRFFGQGGFLPVHRHQPGRAVGRGNGRGELEHALAPDKVDVERRPERIFAPAAAGDATAGFARDGVVQRDHPRPGGIGGGQGLAPHMCEDRLDRQALEQAILRRPVPMLRTGGAQGSGHRMPAQIKQAGQPLGARPGKILRGGEDRSKAFEQ